MGEFLDVIHQTKRICKSVNGNCGRCLMGEFSCPNNARFDSTDEQEFIDFANAVMSWAAEHPEPVYPSIAKYLEQFGITIRRDGSLQADFFKANEPMSADMAKLLGIEPKEGT